MAGSCLKGVGAVVGEGHCSGPAVSSGSCSTGGERSALAELCRALPYRSWVLGTGRTSQHELWVSTDRELHRRWCRGAAMGLGRWHTTFLAGLLPCQVLGCRESKSLPCCNAHLPVHPQSLPKSHVETRERQTIIPHGVPFMVKLLCYYVSEDSIFLHLEHVQGE